MREILLAIKLFAVALGYPPPWGYETRDQYCDRLLVIVDMIASESVSDSYAELSPEQKAALLLATSRRESTWSYRVHSGRRYGPGRAACLMQLHPSWLSKPVWSATTGITPAYTRVCMGAGLARMVEQHRRCASGVEWGVEAVASTVSAYRTGDCKPRQWAYQRAQEVIAAAEQIAEQPRVMSFASCRDE